MSQYLSQIHEGQVTVTKGAQRSLHIEIAHHDTLFGGVVAMTLLPVLTARGAVRKVCVGRSTGLGALALLCRLTKSWTGECREEGRTSKSTWLHFGELGQVLER